MCIGHNACCGVERIVTLLSLCAVFCRFAMPCMCALHIIIIVWELLFSLLVGDWLIIQCCLWCMSVMVVAQHHHMWPFYVIYHLDDKTETIKTAALWLISLKCPLEIEKFLNGVNSPPRSTPEVHMQMRQISACAPCDWLYGVKLSLNLVTRWFSAKQQGESSFEIKHVM